MLTYLTAYPSDTDDALFLYHSGRLLTRQELTEELRQLLPLMGTSHARDYAGHSFRIGTATTAVTAITPDWLITAMGRWRRNSVLRYIRMTDTAIAADPKAVRGTGALQNTMRYVSGNTTHTDACTHTLA